MRTVFDRFLTFWPPNAHHLTTFWPPDNHRLTTNWKFKCCPKIVRRRTIYASVKLITPTCYYAFKFQFATKLETKLWVSNSAPSQHFRQYKFRFMSEFKTKLWLLLLLPSPNYELLFLISLDIKPVNNALQFILKSVKFLHKFISYRYSQIFFMWHLLKNVTIFWHVRSAS